MLSDPFFDDALEKVIAAQYNSDKVMYKSNARLWTQKYATGKRPTDEELDVAGEWNKKLAGVLEKNRSVRRRWDQYEGMNEARAEGLW